MRGYYDLKEYVSNSDLSELRDALYLRTKPAGLQQIYDFGNLVDSSITEAHKIQGNVLTLEAGGEKVIFEPSDIERAQLIKEAYDSRQDLKTIFNGAIPQYVYLRKAQEINYNGFIFTLPVRCKLDLNKKAIIGGDLKTTACTTYEAFRAAIDLFDYDRQAAWYMDLGRLPRFMFIGLGKKPNKKGLHPVFTHLVERGDPMYEAGRAKYSKLAFQYNFLIKNFSLQ